MFIFKDLTPDMSYMAMAVPFYILFFHSILETPAY